MYYLNQQHEFIRVNKKKKNDIIRSRLHITFQYNIRRKNLNVEKCALTIDPMSTVNVIDTVRFQLPYTFEYKLRIGKSIH